MKPIGNRYPVVASSGTLFRRIAGLHTSSAAIAEQSTQRFPEQGTHYRADDCRADYPPDEVPYLQVRQIWKWPCISHGDEYADQRTHPDTSDSIAIEIKACHWRPSGAASTCPWLRPRRQFRHAAREDLPWNPPCRHSGISRKRAKSSGCTSPAMARQNQGCAIPSQKPEATSTLCSRSCSGRAENAAN